MSRWRFGLAPESLSATRGNHRIRIWLGIVFLLIGLLGHLLAAHAMGGSHVAYTHHIFGFVFLSVVSGAIIAGLVWRFWKGRHDITILTLGVLQAILGVWVYAGQV